MLLFEFVDTTHRVTCRNVSLKKLPGCGVRQSTSNTRQRKRLVYILLALFTNPRVSSSLGGWSVGCITTFCHLQCSSNLNYVRGLYIRQDLPPPAGSFSVSNYEPASSRESTGTEPFYGRGGINNSPTAANPNPKASKKAVKK